MQGIAVRGQLPMSKLRNDTNPPSRGRRLAILGYHKVGEPDPTGWESWFLIPETTFVDQLRYLQENDWQVIDLTTFLRGLDEPASLPERAALISFDDGYRSNLLVALPCLRRFGYPAVLFMPTNYIGGHNSFDAGNEPEEVLCDWGDLRELEQQGVSIQSHGMSHRGFSELSLTEQEEELCRSKAILEAGLEKPVAVFSFPYGDAGSDPPAVGRLLQRTGYRAACLYGGGVNAVPLADLYHLARVAMGPDTDLQAELEQEVGHE